jgi:hypothetical protein
MSGKMLPRPVDVNTKNSPLFAPLTPPGFPLRVAPKGFLPERLYLTDRERWNLAPP